MNRRQFQKNFFCVILSFILLVSGMCLTLSEADSVLLSAQSYNTKSTPISYLSESEALAKLSSSCIDETLSARSAGTRLALSKRNEKSCGQRTILHQSILEVSPEKSIFYFEQLKKQALTPDNSRHTIIGYIHKQDGEKG